MHQRFGRPATSPAAVASDRAEPERRLSVLRVGLALAVTAGAVTMAASSIATAIDNAQPVRKAWFAPYVDTTLTPQFAFEDPNVNPNRDVVLGFVVASPTQPCGPSWGGTYSMDEAATGLELERRIARLRTGGSDAFVSFGGARNTELASSCTDTEALKKAYAAVVDRYRFTTVDLDIEGATLADRAATNRRAVAMSALQSTKRSGGTRVAVWLTLPVSPNGLSADGVAQVDAMLAAKVDLAGINAMTMDYGSSRTSGDDQWKASRKALITMHRQVRSAYKRAGVELNAKSVWNKIGATPMIGLNDQPGEMFTLAGANSLAGFAVRQGMARVSIWSLNRDQQCGANSATGQVSNYCSGVTQKSAAFSGVFRRLAGSRGAGLVATRPDVVPTQSDDPATSPYPIWSENGAYPLGRKVVWHGQVYSAKWWIQGQMPDAPIVNEWDSAWHLVGPVLKGEKPVPMKVVAPGTYPEWSPQTAYAQGTKVLLGGSAYEAKWWTKGTPPDFAPAHEYDTPWKAFG